MIYKFVQKCNQICLYNTNSFFLYNYYTIISNLYNKILFIDLLLTFYAIKSILITHLVVCISILLFYSILTTIFLILFTQNFNLDLKNYLIDIKKEIKIND